MKEKIKALFFAQYLGQEVLLAPEHAKPIELFASHLMSSRFAECFLLLRSIEQLTDEEYCTVMDIVFQGKGYSIAAIKDIIDGWLSLLNKETGGYLPKNYLTLIDYLRTIGILLPFTYLSEDNRPITLTPTDIVNAGWVKLNK